MRHRRKNPVNIDSNTILMLGLIVGGGYLFITYLLPLLQGVTSTVSNAAGSVTSGIANLFPGTSSSVQVQGTVSMPDGSTFPASNLSSLNFQTVNGQAQFTWNGSLYALTPQVNGTYQAIAM